MTPAKPETTRKGAGRTVVEHWGSEKKLVWSTAGVWLEPELSKASEVAFRRDPTSKAEIPLSRCIRNGETTTRRMERSGDGSLF